MTKIKALHQRAFTDLPLSRWINIDIPTQSVIKSHVFQ